MDMRQRRGLLYDNPLKILQDEEIEFRGERKYRS